VNHRILKLVGLVSLMLIFSQLLVQFSGTLFSAENGLLGSSLQYFANILFASLGIFIGLKLVDRSISHNIQATLNNQPPEQDCDESIAPLCKAYHDQASQLEQRGRDLVGASNQLASSAAQISETTEHTQTNTSKHQIEIDMVATAMNEMTATVEEVARNAEQATRQKQKSISWCRTSTMLPRF